MHRRGIKPEELASELNLSVRTIRNVACENNQSLKCRQKITDFLGESIWPQQISAFKEPPLMKTSNSIIRCIMHLEHPNKKQYDAFVTANNVKNPLPHPPLVAEFTMNCLPEVGDILDLTHSEKEGKFRITNRIFFATAGDSSGETAVKLEGVSI
jgi:hypothetical protein